MKRTRGAWGTADIVISDDTKENIREAVGRLLDEIGVPAGEEHGGLLEAVERDLLHRLHDVIADELNKVGIGILRPNTIDIAKVAAQKKRGVA